ncbi:MAG: ParB/RepB/Spo0J family partition protein [Janthinobacterium lividum]
MTRAKYDNVPLDCIRASATNPRKRFDQAALVELAESIKQLGVAQPIVLRPVEPTEGKIDTLEIVAGERRYRASTLAGMPSIPAIIRELDDAQALEIQVIENMQREDLHPIEEAEGYEQLIKSKTHPVTVQQLADKVGKSTSYINKRLKYLALEPEARDAFFANKLTPATAMMVARIPVKHLQAKAVKEITSGYGGPMSSTMAQSHIRRTFMLELKQAPFDTTDAKVVPAAGACTTCPKRTGNQPELFDDVDSADVCTDPECFGAKREAWSKIRLVEAKASGQKILDSKAAAKVFPYGGNSPSNGFHAPNDRNYQDAKNRTWKQLAKAAGVEIMLAKNPKTGDVVEVISEAAMKPHLKVLGLNARQTSSASELEAVRKAKDETIYRGKLFAAVRAAAAGKMHAEERIDVVLQLIARVESNDRNRLLVILGWPRDLETYADRDGRIRKLVTALTPAAREDLMRDCVLISEAHAGQYSSKTPEKLLAAAARYGVDAKSIKAELKAVEDTKKKAKAKNTPVVRKPAKPKAKPATAKVPLHPAKAAGWPYPSSKGKKVAA